MKSRTWMWTTVVYLFAALAMQVGMAAQGNPSQEHKHKHHQYRLIILGTFGGPQSYLTAGSVLTPSGTAMGWADTPLTDPYFPNCFNPDCFVSHTFSWQEGVMTDLGALPGNNSSSPNWMAKNRLIAGTSENGMIDPLTGFPEIRATLWKEGGIIDLGTLGGNESFANSVNNRGQVVGPAANSIADQFSPFWFGWGTQTRAFLWRKGAMQDLGTLGGPDAFALVVNEGGQIAGFSYTNSIPNGTTGQPTLDTFFWERGKMVDIGTLGGTITLPNMLNNRGQIVGQSNLAGDVTFHPFLWDKGALTDLGTLGGDTGTTNTINDAGEVIGKADLPGSQTHHGFLWKEGMMTDLGTVGTDACSNAWNMNLKEQVVGNSSDCVTPLHGFLWENGGPMVDVNTLISPPSDFLVNNALAINDRGEIAGVGVFRTGEGHAYVLIPDGDCDDDCEGRIAASQNTAAPEQYSATMKQRNETPISPAERLRSMMRQHYRIPGRPAAQRD
jgi:probable HAF family extracellular repeat protein